jgi:glutathione S-transferase
MKLYGSLTSPFVRKVRIALAEQALACDFVIENPRSLGSNAQRTNPLGKVPVLELDDGGALYDSPVILEYLDTLAPTPLVPSAAPDRWTVLRLQALADGLLESIVRVWLEGRLPEAERRQDFFAWESRRLERALSALAKEPKVGPYFTSSFSVADIAVVVALDYLDLRVPQDWRGRWPDLAAWRAPIAQRPSFIATALADKA